MRNLREAGARTEGLCFITHMRHDPKLLQPDTLPTYGTESLLVWRYSASKWYKKLTWESTGTRQASHSKVVAMLHGADEALLHCWVNSTSLLHTVQPVCNRPSNLTKDCLLSSCPAPARSRAVLADDEETRAPAPHLFEQFRSFRSDLRQMIAKSLSQRVSWCCPKFRFADPTT